jgi:hypothetical protein
VGLFLIGKPVIAYFRREWIVTALWVVWIAPHPVGPNGTIDDRAVADLTRRRRAGLAVATQVLMTDDARVNRLIPQSPNNAIGAARPMPSRS